MKRKLIMVPIMCAVVLLTACGKSVVDDKKVVDDKQEVSTDSKLNSEVTEKNEELDKQEESVSETANAREGYILESGETVAAPEGTVSVSISDEANAEFLFTTGSDLKNIKLISLSTDGEKYTELECLYQCDKLEKGKVLKVSCYLPDLFSNLLLQYDNSKGETCRYLVEYDMKDTPRVVLEELEY